jgi:murein DD-endopeptidase MepM/ murein hydrolase activator NlpD
LSRRDHYSLLVIRGDGARILRVTIPRRVATAVLVAVVMTLSASVALLGNYVQLRKLTSEARGYLPQLAQQQQIMTRVSERVAELHREASVWRELHTRIWEAMGPETQFPARQTGIGGAAAAVVEPRPARLSPIDELDRLAEQVKEEGENLRALDRVMARAGKMLAALPSRWPVRGAVNSEFGLRLSPWTKASEFHSGMDIGAQPGSPILAPAGGMVTFAGAHPEYGLTVMIDHGHDIRTVYGHLSRISGHSGQQVERGTLIGLSGNTGRSSGPHLHYEIQVKGRQVNPRAYLWD